MHGLINRSIQCFVRDTYGADRWAEVCARAKLESQDFEALLTYDDALTDAVIRAASELLEKERVLFLEDLGHYLVTHPESDALRRLLRFGGETFVDFLHSLEELHDRGRLALPDLDLPRIEMREHGGSSFTLGLCWGDLGPVVLGVLRAMADEYGALVLMEYHASGAHARDEAITIELLETTHAEGRSFALGRVRR
ncbi:heme NO-binding protein [Maritimibacter sp. 55A14]|uniref:heme NO-binding domain-containing protein n=1 Tax=Maritimibacter sp. 55A14 TaxID=2174844 RepID=UPI000D61644B|nr:heme NO-binding domain-containing protein [Maritimibacter sp. 55A14]PWE29276.1 heme NO-binding protein [Maritimibacter sp. 55A14]